MAEPPFRLPNSGFEQLSRILKAYYSASRGSTEAAVTSNDVARRAAMNRTAVSANNGFFVSVGLIEGGNAKRLTPLGLRAALALDHAGSPEAEDTWAEVVQNAPDLERIVDAVRIRQGMDEEALLSHIVLTAGVPKTSRWLTGARAVVDVLEFAGLVSEEDGVFKVAAVDGEVGAIRPRGREAGMAPTERVTSARTTTGPGIVVNVHLWVTAADADLPNLAEELKDFLAKLAGE